MPVAMGVWRIDGDAPRRLVAGTLPSEAVLEEYLERDATLLGQQVLIVGRQVRTAFGKYIDLLAMDADGNLHVLELKRDRTPREVVAQLLDYGSWVSQLDRHAVISIAEDHLGSPFEAAFADTFGAPPPDELNGELTLTIVATELDPSSERIVMYLRTFSVPVNALFFTYLEDDDRRYLARSWLETPDDAAAPTGHTARKRADWNGRDWFVSFGVGPHRAWEDARRYGFVSAGGGRWYSRTVRSLPVGARVFVHVPQHGYVGIGETTGSAQRADEATVVIDGRTTPLRSQDLRGSYVHAGSGGTVSDDDAEWIVPVRWLQERPLSEAYWERGLFASQHSACKLRQAFTIERVTAHFGLDGSEA